MRNAALFTRRKAQMTPLIDVVFLLLLFFMLSSTFSTFGEIELSQATAGANAQGEAVERTFVQLSGARVTVNGADATLGDLAEAIEAGQVLVSLDTDVTAQRVVDLLVQLRGRDDLDVLVLE